MTTTTKYKKRAPLPKKKPPRLDTIDIAGYARLFAAVMGQTELDRIRHVVGGPEKLKQRLKPSGYLGFPLAQLILDLSGLGVGIEPSTVSRPADFFTLSAEEIHQRQQKSREVIRSSARAMHALNYLKLGSATDALMGCVDLATLASQIPDPDDVKSEDGRYARRLLKHQAPQKYLETFSISEYVRPVFAPLTDGPVKAIAKWCALNAPDLTSYLTLRRRLMAVALPIPFSNAADHFKLRKNWLRTTDFGWPTKCLKYAFTNKAHLMASRALLDDYCRPLSEIAHIQFAGYQGEPPDSYMPDSLLNEYQMLKNMRKANTIEITLVSRSADKRKFHRAIYKAVAETYARNREDVFMGNPPTEKLYPRRTPLLPNLRGVALLWHPYDLNGFWVGTQSARIEDLTMYDTVFDRQPENWSDSQLDPLIPVFNHLRNQLAHANE